MILGECKTCQHYWPGPAGGRAGTCREQSPTPILMGVHPEHGPRVDGFQAPVGETYCCGRYKAVVILR